MSHSTTLTIGGSAVDPIPANPFPVSMSLSLDGVSTLTLRRRADASPGGPDAWLGKTVTLAIDGTLRFAGDVTDAAPDHDADGWSVVYQCRCLRARADRARFVDSSTLSDQARYNLDAADPDKIDARQGRNVGQILADALTMTANATALDAMGIGGYSSLSPPTLPAETVADLAGMTVIPPREVAIGGDGLGQALAGFVRQHAPNRDLWIRPDGVIRFPDRRSVVENVLTVGDCDQRVSPSPLSRSVAECRQRIEATGRALALPFPLSLSDGTLEEVFAWGSYATNADAKAAWTTDDYLRDQNALNVGSCSCSDAAHVVVTSAGATWAANEWDQTNRRGVVYLSASSGTGLTVMFASRVVANTAKTSGGTSTLTLETPLPALTYDSYKLCGFSSGASYVWRRYRAVAPTIRAALVRRFSYEVPWLNSTGSTARLVSIPEASVTFSNGGGTDESPMGIVSIDPSAGTFLLDKPTWIVAGDKAPTDVRILAAVNVAALSVASPSAGGFAGTSHSQDGLSNTFQLYLPSWTDPANNVNAQAYVDDLLDSVKDAMIDGSVSVDDLYVPALSFGNGISLSGNGYLTGWEGANVPIVGADVTWNLGPGRRYSTTIRVSNRRASYALSEFMQPERNFAAGVGSGDVTMLGAPLALGQPSGNSGAFDPDAVIASATGLDRPMEGANVSGRYAGRGSSNYAEREARKAAARANAKAERESRSERIAAANRAEGRERVGPPSPFPNEANSAPKTNRAAREASKAKARADAKAGRLARSEAIRRKNRAKAAPDDGAVVGDFEANDDGTGDA